MAPRSGSHGRSAIALAAALVATLNAATALAVSLRATPSLTIEERWDSNIVGAPNDEVEDFVLRATPSLVLSVDVFRSTINLSGSVDGEKYARHDELDRFTATKYIDLSPTEPLQMSPYLSLRPSAQFLETRDALRRNTLAEAPTPSLPLTETAVTPRIAERDYTAALAMTYLVSPNVDLSIVGLASRREFLEDAPGLFESRTLSGDASALYHTTPRFFHGVFFNVTHTSFDGRPSSRTYAGGLAGTYVVSPQTTVESRAGASYARESAALGSEVSETWAPYGRLSLAYTSHDFLGILAGSYELSGTTSFGTTTQRGTIYLALSDRFSPRWSWRLSNSCQISRSTDPAVTLDLVTWNGAAGIDFAAAEWMSLRLSGEILRQLSHGETGADLKRDTVALGLVLRDTYNIF